ncbi:regulatory protein GemA [Agrobacterium salinitolerans]|uniref:regulatory protein GemA n=1 Tax=Agrobacterium salinitolerans TaxID=1183413 RepID=UPI0022B81714|nr:regulatory protein GemA [Agrobacterium salinitolerans]MCZ7886029.1 regulatory protein GemA [Agrobacterium salinitolerans]
MSGGSIAAIKIAQKQLGLDDDTYRAKLKNITGKTSTLLMTEQERKKVLKVFRGDGAAKPATVRQDGRNGKHKLSGKYLPKMRALWIACWNLGIVEQRRDSALEKFAMGRQLPELSDIRFVHKPGDASSVIEALKAMLARAGVQWADHHPCEAFEKSAGYKIARAQWAILAPGSSRDDFWPFVTELLKQPATYREVTDAEWIFVMNYLGPHVRKKKGPAR